jgi:hypothetical protein
MKQTLFTVNQVQRVSGLSRRTLQTLEEKRFLAPVVKRYGSLGGMSEYSAGQVFAATVAHEYVKAGADRAVFWAIAKSVAAFDREAMLALFREGLTELTFNPLTKQCHLMPGDPKHPGVNVEAIYKTVTSQLETYLACEHPQAISQDPYCPTCGTRIGTKSQAAKRNAQRNGTVAELKK